MVGSDHGVSDQVVFYPMGSLNGLEFQAQGHCHSLEQYTITERIYDGRLPILSIMDIDLIKTIFIKEFYTLFTNKRNFGLNGLFEESVMVVEDDHWKRIRSVLSPSFTSGRLKEMCPIIQHYTRNLVKYAEKKAKLNESADMKDIFGAYAMDVITSATLSVDVDSINNPNDPLITNTKEVVKFNIFDPPLILSYISRYPKVRR
ncbi:cytochrome P450 3A40-like [Scyliorhinus torazame]|uniref:cytochrome P450 3A40-like n=1 Tax=Scyliorhinus torazame TaxID=75743 RepID=UPI003B5C93AE